MIHLDLQPELEARRTSQAKARGLALDRYLEDLLSAEACTRSSLEAASHAVDRIRELRKGNLLGGLSNKDLVNEGRKY